MALADLPRAGAWTLADLEGLPDDGCRHELVDGALVMTPAPSQRHQHRATALRDVLQAAAPAGWRCTTEWAVPLAADTQRTADLAVYRWPPRHPRPDDRSPVGPADLGLVAEVVSPSSRRTDRFAKPGEYAEAGIPVFWRLETDPELVLHVFALDGDSYVGVARVAGRGAVPVPWGELVVDLRRLDD